MEELRVLNLYFGKETLLRGLLKTTIFLIVVILVLGVLGVGAVFYLNRPTADIPLGGSLFIVQTGETLEGISRRLKETGIIRSSFLLKVVSRINNTTNKLKTGAYRLEPGMSTTDIHSLIVKGQQSIIKVTIPEGWTINKIARLLEDRGIVGSDEFIAAAQSAAMVNELNIPGDSVEGYLFPDTYFLPEVYPAESIIRIMVETFFENLQKTLPDFIDWKRKELHEHVILASIVEREYRVKDEAPLIASVFKNRLKYNIGLESCATLEYIITEIQGKTHPKYITLEDTAINSVYNTYKWAGLPPGPISNPGRIALEATFHNPETDYYYFVLRDPETGTHYFSNDLEDHNRAKVFYLKG